MGWHLRVSRFGSTHHVFHQENVNACGTACALMLFQRLRGVKLNSQDVYRGYDAYGNQQFGTRAGAAVGANYDGSAGTWYDDMARYLRNSLGMPCTSYQGSHQECAKSPLQTVGDGGVVLASIGWYDTLVKGTFIAGRFSRNGGHWVLFDKVSSFAGTRYMVASDPGDGHVQVFPIRENSAFWYEPDYGRGTRGGILDGLVHFPK
jgi:hypothetical protein